MIALENRFGSPALVEHDPTWREALAQRRFRAHLVATAVALPLVIAALSRFLLWVEERPGTVLDDPLLAAIPPADCSVPAFALIYGGLVLGVAMLARHPFHLLRAVQGYVLLLLLRMLCMWATPLDPPKGFVPLHDPVVESLGPATALTRDLFFSGHTSTLFLLALCVPQRWAKAVMLTATVVVAFLLLRQHAHYTVDVLVAPLASVTAYVLAGRAGPARVQEPGYAGQHGER